ncbi:MAG: DUF72 domain-containing protein [Candidatus Thorarchaeota archaeon]
MKKGLHIGTSGWSYDKDWRGVFYSSGGSLLKQYLKYFYTSEINSTFYALPTKNFVKHLSSLDDNVFFTAKLPKAVTHDTRLDLRMKDGKGRNILNEFFSLLEPLHGRVQVLLIQLPPWELSKFGELENFFSALDSSFRYAIEFRNESWLVPRVWSLIEDYGIAHVIVDEPKLPIDLRVTTDFSYIRWHGHGEDPWFNYRYSLDELKPWVPRLEQVTNAVPTTFGYFNNHFAGNAPLNAFQMLSLMKQINPKQQVKLDRMLRASETKQSTLDSFF